MSSVSDSGSLMARISSSSQESAAETQLSQEAFDRLSKELRDLTTRGRVEIAQIIETARELGDLKENGDYHAAKEEQGKMEARIRQLEHLLSKAVVGEGGAAEGESASDGVVALGSLVTVRHDDGDTETFQLASVEERPGARDLLSPQSPLGSALLGSKVGDEVSYTVTQPSGKEIEFSVEVAGVEAGGV